MDGVRACAKKGGAAFLEHEAPDILCLQETKVRFGGNGRCQFSYDSPYSILEKGGGGGSKLAGLSSIQYNLI